MTQDSKLDPIRRKITSIDTQLLSLLADRRELSLDVARTKANVAKPVRDTERENALLTRLVNEGRGLGLDGQYISRIFHTIIEDSVLRQQAWFQAQQNPDGKPVTRVAYLGAKGSYSYLAAHNYFGRRDTILQEMGMPNFGAIIDAVEQGQADHGILPLENTSSGSINEVYDLLQHTNLHIIGETTETIAHSLLAQPGVAIESIKTIYAHPQPHAQCSRYLEQFTDVHREYCASSAEAMEKAAQDKASAAIGSEQGGALYGLQVLGSQLANQQQNETRFIVVARKAQQVPPQVPAKTTLIMATGQRAGALVETLQVFQQHGINLTKLESRPIFGNPWEEMFYLDVEANVESKPMAATLAELTRLTKFIKVLGCYPCETILPTELGSEAMAQDPRLDTDATFHQSTSGLATREPIYSRAHKGDNTKVQLKNCVIGGHDAIVMAGPAMVETQSQILSVARGIKEHGGNLLFASCTPTGASAVNDEKLTQLRQAGDQVDLPVVSDVNRAEDVQLMATKVDALLITGKHMTNTPLLEAAGRTQKPVFLERAPDSALEHWLTCAETILSQGNQQVVLCDSGQKAAQGSSERTQIDLTDIARLVNQTHLPIILCPSLSTEKPELLMPIAKGSKGMGVNGIWLSVDEAGENQETEGLQLSLEQYGRVMKALHQ